MGIHNTEVFQNLGLCCYYAQQYDMALTCILRALKLASDEHLPNIWYNIGHIALVSQHIYLPAYLYLPTYFKMVCICCV